jgi:hypothetical protein
MNDHLTRINSVHPSSFVLFFFPLLHLSQWPLNIEQLGEAISSWMIVNSVSIYRKAYAFESLKKSIDVRVALLPLVGTKREMIDQCTFRVAFAETLAWI